MKYKFGDRVIPLVERGVAHEGDVGVVDAIHKENGTYTVGFYAAEDCLVGSSVYYEEELRPFEEKDRPAPFAIGDIVKTKKTLLQFPKGSMGEVLQLFPETKGVAVKVSDPTTHLPFTMPYGYDELELIEKHEHHHEH